MAGSEHKAGRQRYVLRAHLSSLFQNNGRKKAPTASQYPPQITDRLVSYDA
jgi:hypothetical protein